MVFLLLDDADCLIEELPSSYKRKEMSLKTVNA